MKKNPKYPFKHLSVRVPWHDNAWNGTICTDPKSNGACLILKNCAQSRDDKMETDNAGTSIENLDESKFPVCVGERGTFMASFPFYKYITHPYVKASPGTHGHLKPTRVRFPAFSASAVPYNWMLKDNTEEKTNKYGLDFDSEREPVMDWEKTVTNSHWVQEYKNQKALLNCFFEHFENDASLVFFYAKQVPFFEDSGRVLVGVGRIKDIIPSAAYEGSSEYEFSAAYWEHMVQHSIRPDFTDGFILPYHDAIEYQKTHPEFDIGMLTVTAPLDKQFEFSFAAEHVSNDATIRVLLKCVKSIELAREKGFGKHHDKILQWIHNEIARIEKLRGDYPGMGAALCALGIEKGHFVAAEIINSMPEGANPWELFEKAISQPQGILSDETASEIQLMVKKTYQRFAARENKERLNLLHLLSRFDLEIDQARMLFRFEMREAAGINITDVEILLNPYLIYELTRQQAEPVDISTVDLGLFITDKKKKLLPESAQFNDPLDERRIRALTMRQLDIASLNGNTLLPRKDIVNQIRELALSPKCDANSDHFEIAEEIFAGVIEITEMKNGDCAYQLKSLADGATLIRQKVKDRQLANRFDIKEDWEVLLAEAIKKASDKPIKIDDQEINARKEKATALIELASSRISVLIGPAGTGKTTLLTVLASQSEIKKGGVILLAPTGKARVRIEEVARGASIQAFTIAQFLNKYKRYNGELQRYVLSDQYCEAVYETVILDEASMLTEEMLATVMDCFRGVKRFILVGDHRQLPPIGSGRPFVDIINYLKPADVDILFPKVAPCYTELTIRRRQGGTKRQDLQLAEWFSGSVLEPGADHIINEIIHNKNSKYLRLENFEKESDFEKVFQEVLKEELGLNSLTDVEGFNKTLGSSDGKYFNDTNDAKYFKIEPSVKKVEAWQILSPVREKVFGVRAVNRSIHQQFRKGTISYCYGGKKYTGRDGNEYAQKKLPKPVGIEEIVYGDKVINLGNHKRLDVYPEENALQYIANGEIGIVTGQYKRSNGGFTGQPKFVKIEFTSQKGFTYTFKQRDFSEDGDQPLELAYAITVHKSQGSEFGKVFLIIPNPCFLLTREMLYTALTRQKDKVIVIYQGTAFDIKQLSSPIYSDTLTRITNLFEKPQLVEVDGKFLEKNLIHQASDGRMLRSKSELMIYQRLYDKGLKPLYEKRLEIKEVEKLPDFTIELDDLGKEYFWEHCGMMHDREYAERWEEKYKWYLENDILPWQQGGGKRGTLIVTEDKAAQLQDGSLRGAISVKEIDEIISKLFNK